MSSQLEGKFLKHRSIAHKSATSSGAARVPLALGLSFPAAFKQAFAGAIQAEDKRVVLDLLVTLLTNLTLFFYFWWFSPIVFQLLESSGHSQLSQ